MSADTKKCTGEKVERLARCAAAETTSKEIQKHVEETQKWIEKEKNELIYNISEGHNLLEMKERAELMVKSLKQPLEISQENLLYIQQSCGFELIKDSMEESLANEVEIVRENGNKLEELIQKLNMQLKRLFESRHELEKDITSKQDVQNTEECVKLLCSLNLNIEYPPEAFNMKHFSDSSWIQKTKVIIQKSQEERKYSQTLKAIISHVMVHIGNECFGCWYETNAHLHERIQRLQRVQESLVEKFHKICFDIQVLNPKLNCIQEALQEKIPALKIAQTRVDRRTKKLNGMDHCRDKIVMTLYREMHIIQLDMNKLNVQHAELKEKMKKNVKNKKTLEKELRLNDMSLFLYRDKCLHLRQSFPIESFREFRCSKLMVNNKSNNSPPSCQLK